MNKQTHKPKLWDYTLTYSTDQRTAQQAKATACECVQAAAEKLGIDLDHVIGYTTSPVCGLA